MSEDGIPPIIYHALIHGKDHEKQVKRYEKEFAERMVELAVSQGEKKENIDWGRVAGYLIEKHERKVVSQTKDKKEVDCYKVACDLAKKYEPKLQDKTPRGRKRKWGVWEIMLLAVDVERLTDCGMTVDAAIKEIATADLWVNFLSAWEEYKSRDIVAALKKRYKKHSEESKIAGTAIKGLRELPQEEWDQLLKNTLKTNKII
jgi:hypothetical protein